VGTVAAMSPRPLVLPSLVPEAVVDARAALVDPHHRRADLMAAAAGQPIEPTYLCVDAWIYDPTGQWVLLVHHRRRGWVMPGGKVDVGETPRQACAREVAEETGLRLSFEEAEVAAITEGTGELPHLGLSYGAVAERWWPLTGEPGQSPQWWPLTESWDSVYPHDRPRLQVHRDRMTPNGGVDRYSPRS
jgi:8-oxo-dGTP diphosphatase